MQIQQEDNGKKGAFYVEEEGKRVAEMTYVWAGPSLMIIDHTEVDTSLEGKGVGNQLVHAAVEFARGKNIKILPLCPFAKKVIENTPAYFDILNT
jgi:uncharacterized protein